MTDRLIINCCPTGMVPTKAHNPHVPITPKEIAMDIKRCYEAGASMAHVHARNFDEQPTYDPKIFEEILHEIVCVTPDIILVATTSGRNWPEFEKRSACLNIKGTIKPEMASLTLGSMNFPKSASVNPPEMIKSLALKMQEEDIVPELEIFDTGMMNYAHYLIEHDILKPPYYFNILLGSLGTASLSAANMAAILAGLPQKATWAFAGIGRFQLAANTIAIAMGGHVRVGIEDNVYYDWKNSKHASNPALVERLVKISRELHREPATPSEAREIIGLKQITPRK